MTDTPTMIGPYRLLDLLGEGGMGEVWRAEQSEPVKRRVALKLIKLGMDTQQVVARFEAERQALAVMDHPSIARVLDAGSTEAGRPYFVMELVKGVPITEYCDTHKLSTNARLDLFTDVCRAVQHAHQKGVIHRDLKPGNVLVSITDDKPIPKIIDFGIAKAMGQGLTDQTLVTGLGQFLGTPAYMSPEQAAATGLDVDTRTDIYSLGVMLYELLAGAQPFNFQQIGVAAILNVIREQDPAPPSSRLTTLPGDNQNTIAHYRRTDARSLKRELRGDLDWVIMKAMEKDRTRRYETASGLAIELERFVANEPVLARPPSAAYRASKFVRRHRAALGAVAAVFVALTGGVVAATVGLLRAQRAEAVAQVEATTAEQVSTFMVDLFEVSDPGEALGNEVTAREILDNGAARIDSLADQPLVQARLRSVMGDVYRKLALYDRASPLLVSALAAQRSLHPGDHEEVAESITGLGELRLLEGDFDRAQELYAESIAMRRRLGDGSAEGLATTIGDLGLLHYQRGELEESETLFREALEMREALYEPDHSAIAGAHNNLGGLLTRAGEFEEAETHLRAALAIWRETLGPDHPSTSSAMNNLGHLLARQGEPEEAEALFREVLAIRRDIFDEGHPNIGTALNNLAQTLVRTGRAAEAEPYMREAVEIQRVVTGSEHPTMALALRGLGAVLLALERYEEAEGYYLESLEVFTSTLGPEHAQAESARGNLARLYVAWGRPTLADRYRTGDESP